MCGVDVVVLKNNEQTNPPRSEKKARETTDPRQVALTSRADKMAELSLNGFVAGHHEFVK